jgi:hypothetical protein
MNTKIFKNFLIKNLYPSTIEDKLGILLLDENISKKKNKYMRNLFKENTPFLETDIFNFKEGKEEKIKVPYETESELQSMMGNEIKKLNFPLLDEKKMENLFTKNFLEKEVKISNLYIEFYTKCFQILRDKKYLEGYTSIGHNINIVDEYKSNNEPYVIKLWILLVCYSFKHLYPEEKWIIFYELLINIQINNLFKNNLIDPFLSDLLFSTFIKYGDRQMCSLLYKELNDCMNIREDYIIFMKLHKKFFYNKDEYEEKRMTDIAAECRSLVRQKDFVAAHEKLAILASDAEKVPSDYSHREFKIKRYEDTFNYVFNEEALYLCSIGDNASIDRLTFLLASIPIKGVAITEGTEYKYESDFEISVREEHQQYINSTNSFNQKCDKLVDLGIAHHNYAIISPNLFRVQSISKVMYGNSAVRDYIFRHHLETTVTSKLRGITYQQYKSLSFIPYIVKVRINHIGQIVSVGEY